MKQLKVQSKLKLALALLIAVLLSPTLSFSASNYGITYGYVPGYSSSTGTYAMSISDIPWSSLSHVAFFAALANNTTITTSGGVVDPLNNQATLISQAHGQTPVVRCYLTVGGASTSNVWPSGTANCKTFADNIVSTAQSLGFDGVDMDCEFPGDSGFPSEADFDTIMNELKSKCSTATPGKAPTGHYADESNFGLIMYLSPGYDVCGYDFPTLISDCDWFTISGYDLNVDTSYNFQGSLIAPISEAFTTCAPVSKNLNRDIEAVSAWYNSQGIPYSKMVLGMPMYGRDASSPNPGKSDNDVFKTGNATAGTYDTNRKEILYTEGTTYGMDNDESYCDKINWSVGQQGMAGIAMFDLGQGLVSGDNYTNYPTLGNIWSAISGGAACVTVGTNPCAPAVCTATPTATATPGCGTLIDNFESGLTENYQGGYWNFYNPGSPITCNPSPWYPTVNDGLDGSLYGGRFYGLTSATNSPSLYTGAGVAPSNLYSVPNGANGIQFTVRMDAGPGGATPAATQLGIDISFGTSGSTTYLYTLTIPAGFVGNNTSAGSTPTKTGTEYKVQILFSQFAYSYGTNVAFDPTKLYQIAFRPGTYSTNGGLYDFTLDDIYYTCPPTPTFTPTSTDTSTPTKTATVTYTSTPSSTFTATITNTATNTVPVTSTFTPTFTTTFTNTFTNTISQTFTNTVTNTFTPTITNTPTITPTPSDTFTPSATNTGTLGPTDTFTLTPTNTASYTYTSTPSYTFTDTPTSSPTNTGTSTNTPNGPTATFTNTGTATYTYTPTDTFSPTITNTPTGPTATFTNTFTATDTPTITNTATNTYTSTVTNTPTMTFTATNTFTPTWTFTATNTQTATWTPTITNTPTLTSTPTNTVTPTPTSLNNVVFSAPFPNPATTGPLQIYVTTAGGASIDMEVFTTAFRKISEHTTPVGSSGPGGILTAVQWDLRDKMGVPVSDGLYYVRVRVTGRLDAVKIFKILVLR
jgi:hypothetical protein